MAAGVPPEKVKQSRWACDRTGRVQCEMGSEDAGWPRTRTHGGDKLPGESQARERIVTFTNR